MNKEFTYSDDIRKNALYWASEHPYCLYLDGNGYQQGFENKIAVANKAKTYSASSTAGLKKDLSSPGSMGLYGFLSYDLRIAFEQLPDKNTDKLSVPDALFFEPEILITLKNDCIVIESLGMHPDKVFEAIRSFKKYQSSEQENINLKQVITKNEYLNTVEALQKHILDGDIYEINYCMDFEGEGTLLSPAETFLRLNEKSPMPHACFFRFENKYLLCASPERFIKKEGRKLISQPIKGTAPRHEDDETDRRIGLDLQNSPKEQAENLMIVDLVRNDLSRVALPGTVKVPDLFKLTTYKAVHQLTSTIQCELRQDTTPFDIIKATFPMGSMTGAPKISAMKLIDRYETMRRGLFSGSVGYINPSGDFDFNVVIRSIYYHKDTSYLSYRAGSAITFDSVPEREYEECLIKSSIMENVLSNK